MTGHSCGAIFIFEERLRRLLQWSICLLHSTKSFSYYNEFPWRHVFRLLHGVTTGPDGSLENWKDDWWGCLKLKYVKRFSANCQRIGALGSAADFAGSMLN